MVPATGTSADGAPLNTGCVLAASASPASRSSSLPSGPITSMAVSVTGAVKTLVKTRSYSRCSSSSLPSTRSGALVLATSSAVVWAVVDGCLLVPGPAVPPTTNRLPNATTISMAIRFGTPSLLEFAHGSLHDLVSLVSAKLGRPACRGSAVQWSQNARQITRFGL